MQADDTYQTAQVLGPSPSTMPQMMNGRMSATWELKEIIILSNFLMFVLTTRNNDDDQSIFRFQGNLF